MSEKRDPTQDRMAAGEVSEDCHELADLELEEVAGGARQKKHVTKVKFENINFDFGLDHQGD